MREIHVSGKRRIFEKLRSEKRSTRADLSRKCSLTRPAVSAIVDELIKDGFVRELGTCGSTGGKPPIVLEFIADSRYAIGINLGRDGLIEGVLCDLACEIIRSEAVSYDNNFNSIISGTEKLIRMLRSGYADCEICGVGVAVSGIIDKDGMVMQSRLDINGCNLASLLMEKTGIYVRVDRRPNAAALAEAVFGAGRGASRMIYLTSGVGVGAGLVYGGKVFTESHGFSGEDGALMLPDNRVLEEIARPRAMLDEYMKKSGRKNVEMNEFIELCISGDKTVEKIIFENARHLAYAAVTAANLFDPDAVILGGDVLDFGDRHFEMFKQEFLKRSFASKHNKAPLVQRSSFAKNGVAAGGALIILDSLIE